MVAFLSTPDRVVTLIVCMVAIIAMVILSRMNLEESPSTVSAWHCATDQKYQILKELGSWAFRCPCDAFPPRV